MKIDKLWVEEMDKFRLVVSHTRLRDHSEVVGDLIFEGKKRQLLSSLNNKVVTQYYVVDFGWEKLRKTEQITLLARFSIKAT